eukprot:tig00000367_g24489.t1
MNHAQSYNAVPPYESMQNGQQQHGKAPNGGRSSLPDATERQPPLAAAAAGAEPELPEAQPDAADAAEAPLAIPAEPALLRVVVPS